LAAGGVHLNQGHRDRKAARHDQRGQQPNAAAQVAPELIELVHKGKFHLMKAGAEVMAVELSAADTVFPGAVDMCSPFREQAAPAGITINVKREPDDGYWSKVWLVKPFVVVQWGARPTPNAMFSLAYKEVSAMPPAARCRAADVEGTISSSFPRKRESGKTIPFTGFPLPRERRKDSIKQMLIG
jgi:hypothetical protein